MEGEGNEVLHQGWLTKSPPLETRKQLFNQSLITPKWRRRWFVLRQGAMPGQFLLHYYTDPLARKLKGVIDLDQCEQVDTGLTYQSGRVSYKFMFDIKTPKRVYYLAADCEADMTAWVDWVCQVCGLRTFATEEDAEAREVGALTVGGRLPPIENELVVSRQPVHSSGDHPAATISSPYMHLSECFTGGHPPPPLSGGHPPPPLASAAAPPPISRHSPDYQNSPVDLPDTSLTCGDDSVFLPSSPTTKAFSPTVLPTSPDPLQQTTGAFAHMGMAGPEVPSAPGRPPKPSSLRHPPPEDTPAAETLLDQDKEANNNNSTTMPPSVNRRLKPEPRPPASLTLGPPVQRSRKPVNELAGSGTYPGPRPPTVPPGMIAGCPVGGPSVPAGMVLPGNSESDDGSNSPDNGSRRNSVDEQIYFYMPSLQQSGGTFMIPCEPVLDHCVQYLDLDLSTPAASTATPKREEEPGTVYKTVDFIKTEAFNRTRQKVEEYKYNIKPESK